MLEREEKSDGNAKGKRRERGMENGSIGGERKVIGTYEGREKEEEESAMEVRVARDERDAKSERERRRRESTKGGTSGGARKSKLGWEE